MAKTKSNKFYAIIKDETVQSVFQGKELPEYNEKQLLVVEVPKDTLPGDGYVDGKIKKMDRIELLRREKVGEVEARTIEMISNRQIVFKGHTFATGSQTYEFMIRLSALFAATGKVPDDFFFLDVNRKKVKMNSSEFKEFVTLVFNQVWSDYQVHINRVISVADARSIDELNSIAMA